MKPFLAACIGVLVSSLIGSTLGALEIGEPAGPLTLLRPDDSQLIMSNYGERPATAVLFQSARCNTTESAIESINKLYRKYRLRDVLYVGVCSNPAESVDELTTFAQRRGMIFPLYRDHEGEAAKRLGAQVTPEVFLLDRTGTLVFRGGLHNDDALERFESAVVSILKRKPLAETSHSATGTPIRARNQPREIEEQFGRPAFSSELIFEHIPSAPAHHCSTLCEAANGDLLCLWYGGSYESSDDQGLFLSRRLDGERTWSRPETLVADLVQPPGNAVIFRDASGRIWVVWGRMESERPIRRGSGWGRCRLMFRTSDDHGCSWSDDQAMFQETLWALPRNPPILLGDETLLLPVSGRSESKSGPLFLTLAPEASQWEQAGFGSGGSQPAVIQRNDGSLLAYLRHSRRIMQIESTDGGQTWSEAEATPLKNPGAGISMVRLQNGHLVLVFNNSETDRTPLSIVRSLDEGRTWEKPFALESNPGEYSYPCVIQSDDGRIHVTYTFRRYSIKHVELNEDWLVHFDRPN